MNIAHVINRFRDKHHYATVRLKAILFDMDGVLFDSMKNHTLAWYKAVSELGIPCVQNEFYQYEGATGRWTINIFLSGFMAERPLRGKSKIFMRKKAVFLIVFQKQMLCLGQKSF